MCGRASLSKSRKELEKRYKASFYRDALEKHGFAPSYNIAPSHLHPVITNLDPGHFQFFRWGLIPYWAKDSSIASKLINSRIETVLEKPSFRQAIRERRCLVPFDAFYEWKKIGSNKIPYRIERKDQTLFSLAGIWEIWKNDKGEDVFSFSVITQAPNELMKDIHDRMPAILLPAQEALWLDKKVSPEAAIEMIRPYPDELLRAYTVSSKLNKVSFNDPSLIEEVPYNHSSQGSLF